MGFPSPNGPPQGTPPLAAEVATSKPVRILACVLCQNRKIKCDRSFPCQNCIKAKVKCTQSIPAPTRKRKRPNQDLQDRLARCEKLLKEYATDKVGSPTQASLQTPKSDDPYSNNNVPAGGKLVKDDGAMRFMDNNLLSTIYEELRATRAMIDRDCQTDESTPTASSPDENSALLLGSDSRGSNVETLWPQTAHVFLLWQVFLERVNPLTKIIHVPTLQPAIVEACGSGNNVSANLQALLFSVFILATISMSPDECETSLNCSRATAIENFSQGVRISLARLNFLKVHDMTTLQALVMYLISLQSRASRHSIWILNGIVVRIAQKMGLHHDGEHLGLTPFESELRRRLWWQIALLDCKFAFRSGLRISLNSQYCNVQEPKNVNDADLYPSATESFQDRDGPTEMIFCILMYRFLKFAISPGMLALVNQLDLRVNGSGGSLASIEEEYRSMIGNFRATLDKMIDEKCDPSAGAVHQLTLKIKDELFAKFDGVLTSIHAREDGHDTKDAVFLLIVNAIAHHVKSLPPFKQAGFLWYIQQELEPDVLMYLAGQLCHRTDGPFVEQAWSLVDTFYEHNPDQMVISTKEHMMLFIFFLKAWSKREDSLRGQLGPPLEPPRFIHQLRSLLTDDAVKNQMTPPDSSKQYATPRHPRQPAMAENGLMPHDPTLDGMDASIPEFDFFDSVFSNSGTSQIMPPLGTYGLEFLRW